MKKMRKLKGKKWISRENERDRERKIRDGEIKKRRSM